MGGLCEAIGSRESGMVVNKPEKIKGWWYEVTGVCSDRDFWFHDVTADT